MTFILNTFKNVFTLIPVMKRETYLPAQGQHQPYKKQLTHFYKSVPWEKCDAFKTELK